MMELPAYLRTTLLRQRWLVAAERFERALVDLEPDYPPEKKQALEQRLALRQEALARAYIALDRLNLRFDPNQPRIPAGAPGAGQWTSGGGGASSSTTSSEAEAGDPLFDGSDTPDSITGPTDDPSGTIIGSAPDGTPIVAAGQDDNFPRRLSTFPLQLEDEEGDKGAHTIRDHVDKSEEYLLRTVRDAINFRTARGVYYKEFEGSFTSLRSANKLVNSTLSEPNNVETVAAVAEGRIREYMKIESQTPFRSPTGYEAFRESPYQQPAIRPTNAVRVVIVHDRSLTRGYRVHTAFPITKKF